MINWKIYQSVRFDLPIDIRASSGLNPFWGRCADRGGVQRESGYLVSLTGFWFWFVTYKEKKAWAQ
jgi:hypothetical protein